MVVLYQLLFAAAVVLGQVTVNNNQTFHPAAPSSAAVIQAKGCVNSKRGLAWPPRNSQHGTPMTSFPAGVISSYFTWGVTPVLNASYPFIPMLWGCDAASVRNFSAAVDANFAVNGYTPHLTKDKAILAFSEPQLASQANCTPEVAVGVWIKYIEPLKKKGYRLGSPAVSVSEKGNAWLLEFMLQCGKKCTPDFLALHWVRPLPGVADGSMARITRISRRIFEDTMMYSSSRSGSLVRSSCSPYVDDRIRRTELYE